MIIQGSNKPIIIIFDGAIAENVSDLKVSLYTLGRELKAWSMEDLVISDDTATAALAQEETIAFPAGECFIEVKWLDKDGITQFNKIVKDRIEFRADKRVMEVSDGD